MHKVVLKIDTKSLYMNILNDNSKGHTCTVATPIVQRNAVNPNLGQIFKIPTQIDFQNVDGLIETLIKNSKSKIRINNVFVFNIFSLNGEPFECDSKFCMFVKEEIDETKYQFGRTKLHYPMGFKFENLNINNKKVLEKISQLLNNYAFIIESFEYDFDTERLNFNALVVGYNGIPYSKVFINTKGAGSKFTKHFAQNYDFYDTEIIPVKKKLGDEATYEMFQETIDDSKEKALQIVEEYLKEHFEDVRLVSMEYPYSLFDFSFRDKGVIKYAIVRFTLTNVTYFDLSSEVLCFLNLFKKSNLFFIKSLLDKPVLEIFNSEELNNFSSEIKAIRFVR